MAVEAPLAANLVLLVPSTSPSARWGIRCQGTVAARHGWYWLLVNVRQGAGEMDVISYPPRVYLQKMFVCVGRDSLW
jgi:hypothetical protein